MLSVCAALVAAEAKLSEWDGAVGDGDCGDTFRRGADAVAAACQSNYVFTKPAQLLTQVRLSCPRHGSMQLQLVGHVSSVNIRRAAIRTGGVGGGKDTVACTHLHTHTPYAFRGGILWGKISKGTQSA